MEITKVGNSFGMYTAKLSFNELEALAAVLSGNAGEHQVVADEMRASVQWHLDNALPGPGEDKDEFKARKDAADGRGTDQVPAGDGGNDEPPVGAGDGDDELERLRQSLVQPPTE